MPKLSQMFPSKWLTAADLNEQDVLFTISGVSEEMDGQGEEAEYKWVVYFTEVSKGLVLNKTNASSLSSCLGDDTDEWIGRKVVLYPTQVQFSGKMVDAIRVKEKATRTANKPQPAAAKPAGKPQQPQPMTQAEVDDDDDLPF